MLVKIFTWCWAAIPIWLAIQAPLARGDYVWLPAYVMGGAAAPISLWLAAVLEGVWWRLLALLVLLSSASWNLSTAIGSSAIHRQELSAPEVERLARQKSLHERDVWLAEEIVRVGWRLDKSTSNSILSGIERLKTTSHYIRTAGCRNLKALDPERVCATLADEEGRLSEARTVERHQEEREKIRQEQLKLVGAPTADVQAEYIHKLLSGFMTVSFAAVVTLLNSIGPLAAEFIGTIMPALIEKLRSQRNIARTREGLEGILPILPEPSTTLPHNLENSLLAKVEDNPPTLPGPSLQPSPEESFSRWCGEHVEESGEDTLQARQAFLHCLSWCARNGEPALSERSFAAMMLRAGFCKQKLRGNMHYLGIRFKSTQLKVVK